MSLLEVCWTVVVPLLQTVLHCPKVQIPTVFHEYCLKLSFAKISQKFPIWLGVMGTYTFPSCLQKFCDNYMATCLQTMLFEVMRLFPDHNVN